ncbi:flagellar type III secretion system protein FlhB [Ramlibacter sp. 2FC]|uniref:EscU/YscU/HrcU family type III secretion system export apparatus switch protein n=1 Tax=Ramlibacter sp. 2FC TaxID=2502188 RepID=UPI0010F9FA6C|nr:flagellar type III secretion system protein FlhB [Ramlibacter sp. 2FC]
MSTDSQDRNLPASARKIRKAREQGQVARSRDLGHFMLVATGALLLATASPWLARWLLDMVASDLRFTPSELRSTAAMGERLAQGGARMLQVIVPVGLVMGLAGVLGALAGGGWNWSLKAVAPSFSKLNPIAGLGRFFSTEQLSQALKASLLSLVLGAVGAAYLYTRLDAFSGMLALPLPAAASGIGGLLLGGLALLLIALGLFAAVDLPLQRQLLHRRLKMSQREARDEHRELEGNQEVKAKIRALMRDQVRRRMMAAVPGADLVVMNPTHYAVALKYEEGRMAAPRVVAKGLDLLAMRIRDLAQSNGVPVLQAPALARALYAHGEVDCEIPAALYAAVAQVLAYVYQLRASAAGRAPMPAGLPELPVPAALDPQHEPPSPPAPDR